MILQVERLQASIDIDDGEKRLDGSSFYALYDLDFLGNFARLGVLDENGSKKLVIEFRIETLKLEADLEEKYIEVRNLAILEDWGPRKIKVQLDELIKNYYRELWLRIVRDFGLIFEDSSLFVRLEETPHIFYGYIHLENDQQLGELFGPKVIQFDQTGDLAD